MVQSHNWFNFLKNENLICMAVGNCLSVLSRSKNMVWSSYIPFITLMLNSVLSGLSNLRKLETDRSSAISSQPSVSS